MLLSLVVPVYREEKNIPEYLRRVRPILSGVTEDYEIIFSLDPSPDHPAEASEEGDEGGEAIRSQAGGHATTRSRRTGLDQRASLPHL